MLITLQRALFGRISDREMALDLAAWTGDGYFGCAAVLVVFTLLSNTPLYAGFAIILGACGYFTRFQKSRIAVTAGVLLTCVCFVLIAILPPHMSGGLMFAFAAWMGTRGTVAIFRLHGRFESNGPSDSHGR